MDPYKIIEKYFDKNSKAYDILVIHSEAVLKKAIQIAKNVPELYPNFELIKQGALLHDIGICRCRVPALGCNGTEPYIKHFLFSRDILRDEGCSTELQDIVLKHIGCGFTVDEIEVYNFPFPKEDVIAKTVEEQIVSIADMYFSKKIGELQTERSLDDIRNRFKKYSLRQQRLFDRWIKKYKLESLSKLEFE